MSKIRPILFIIGLILLFLILLLFFVRLFSERQLDDVSPGIPCKEKLLDRADVLFVIPEFNNQSITKTDGWCERIRKMNKKIGMHGIQHHYNEFASDVNEEDFDRAIRILKNCFEEDPVAFKAPQLALNQNNKLMIEGKSVVIYEGFNQLIHKVYHCNNTGTLRNWFVRVF